MRSELFVISLFLVSLVHGKYIRMAMLQRKPSCFFQTVLLKTFEFKIELQKSSRAYFNLKQSEKLALKIGVWKLINFTLLTLGSGVEHMQVLWPAKTFAQHRVASVNRYKLVPTMEIRNRMSYFPQEDDSGHLKWVTSMN